MRSISETGEFAFIDRIQSLFPAAPDLIQGIGDDCAVIRVGDRIQLVSTDASIEGVHFRRDWSTFEDIGWKAAASAISDIAAMGGQPKFLLTSIAIPESESMDDLESLYRGIAAAAASCGATVIGGDTTRSPAGLMIDVTVIGEALNKRYTLRSGAKAGDMALVIGTPGRARAGLLALQNNVDAAEVIRAHNRPTPRIKEGQWLAEQEGVNAMIDISDGVAQDLNHIAAAAGIGVGMTSASVAVDPELLPICIALGESIPDLVFTGGEDYELACAVDSKHSLALIEEFRRTFNLPAYAIGTFTSEFQGVQIDGQIIERLGYDHFGRNT
jgi:thiamine-monophosphate kinase